jgi:predicted nucleic-acid-binding protein
LIRAVDTSVVLRWILNDDPAQAANAGAVLAEGAYVGLSVLLETGWVLEKKIGRTKASTADALAGLIGLDGVVIDDRDWIEWTLERYSVGADLADMLHLVQSSDLRSFVTFDRKMKRQAGSSSPVPIETLA